MNELSKEQKSEKKRNQKIMQIDVQEMWLWIIWINHLFSQKESYFWSIYSVLIVTKTLGTNVDASNINNLIDFPLLKRDKHTTSNIFYFRN